MTICEIGQGCSGYASVCSAFNEIRARSARAVCFAFGRVTARAGRLEFGALEFLGETSADVNPRELVPQLLLLVELRVQEQHERA